MLVGKRKSDILFYLRKKVTSQLKRFNFSWRFVFIAGLLIYILGFSPFGFARKTIRAIMGVDVAVVDLYAGDARLGGEQSDYKTGWYSEQKAIGEPEMGPSDELLTFSDGNSAFYNGGKYSMILGGFVPNGDYAQPVEEKAPVVEDQVPANEIASTTDELQIKNYELKINETASTSDLTVPASDEGPVMSSPNEASAIDDNGTNAEKPVDNTSVETAPADDKPVEVIEPSVEPATSETPVNVIENSAPAQEATPVEEAKPVTFFDKTINFIDEIGASLKNYYAVAQDNTIDLESFGNFQSATIKLSLAAASISQHKPTSEIASTSDILLPRPAGEGQGEGASTSDVISPSSSEAPVVSSPNEASTSVDQQVIATGTQSRLDNIKDFFAKRANAQTNAQDRIVIWYSTDAVTGTNSDSVLWKELGRISDADASNAINGGYFEYKADLLKNWNDVRNLHIKLEGVTADDNGFVFYLDSAWVSAEYEVGDNSPERESLKRARWEKALEMLSSQKDFKINEKGEIRFKYKKNKEKILSKLGQMFGWISYWSDINLRAELVGADGNVLSMKPTIFFETNGEFVIKLPDLPADFKPGKYQIRFLIDDTSGDVPETIVVSRPFSWGVLALNYDKSVYLPNERAYLQMATLDDGGHTLCDSKLELKITSPSGAVQELSTASGTIAVSEACGPETVTDLPDYYAYYNTAEVGEYKLDFTAVTRNGTRNISDVLNVKDVLPFEIQRVGATRIYPKANYVMTVKVVVNEDYFGDIIETAPSNFRIESWKLKIENSLNAGDWKLETKEEGNKKKLIWKDVKLVKGDILNISYIYDAPDVSPEFHLLGPMSIGSSIEMRAWQIASDALEKRAKTVVFYAGAYNGTGAAGQSTNATNTLPTFTMQLAESGVSIKNAYVVLEAQIGASTSPVTFTGSRIGFDACSGSCTPLPLATTTQISRVDATALTYGESESNQERLLLDVTNEESISAYTGNGAVLSGAVAYYFQQAAAVANSIANSKAMLYVTYTYDATSTNQTNTVIYPLDSTNGTDLGSRQANLAANCTRNNNCPVFDYKMEIPEFPVGATSTSRLSQWFTMYDINTGNLLNDIDPNVNIQGFDVNSGNFHHEAALSTQTAMPAMFFANWTNSGYAENATQQIEYYNATGTNYLIGGEVMETYVASTSAAIKTRTVSFPLGSLIDNVVVGTSSKNIDVYFPENGSATGSVKVKAVWVRFVSHNVTAAGTTLRVLSKIGNDATSSNALIYNYTPGATIIKPSFNIIHIIASTSYAELESANAITAKNINVAVYSNSANFGGLSAELMITYTYTNASEGNGYLSSMNLYGGQSITNGSSRTETLSTANSVMPESSNKTVLAGGLLSYYAFSNSGSAMTAGTILTDANLATSAPACTNAHALFSSTFNTFGEFYKDVKASILTTNNQTYSACYTNDGAAVAGTGAKMNGQLRYTYEWKNNPPTGAFNSVNYNRDSSGIANISIEEDDPDLQEVKAKIQYEAGSSCAFATASSTTINISNVTADFGTPDATNANAYQIGTANAYIKTASGTNTVLFDWQSKTDLPQVDGTYCLRLTTNDLYLDQVTPATTTVYIDNKTPTVPGPLTLSGRTGTSITLNLGATSTETNFVEYKIFYKQANGTDPIESDSVQSSSTKNYLGDQNFLGATTTTITGLTASTTYSFAIWVYDAYGNKASSSRVDIITNDPPTVTFNGVMNQRTNASGVVDLSMIVDDNNNHDNVTAKIDYVLGSACDFSGSVSTPTLDTTQSNIQASWGAPTISNAYAYKIGTTSAYILTSPGANTVSFDWFGKTNLPSGDGTYCVRATVRDYWDIQPIVATSTITIDNVVPTATGALTKGAVTTNSIVLIFATTSPSTDTNPPATNAYKIYYKAGTSGVAETDTEKDSSALDAYNYNGATSTTVTGLNPDANYVFNIWSYDKYGNKNSATEMTAKTNNTIVNNSLTFVNATSTKSALTNSTEWIFRAVVTEDSGWSALDNVKLRLADNADHVTPYADLEFNWSQSTNSFTETGSDASSAVSLGGSSSNCVSNTCTLDFKLIFNKSFGNTGTEYDASLYSTNDSARADEDNYSLLYKVEKIYVNQFHYRWRNDDGGE